MEQTQGPDEKVADYASQLKKLFQQGHPDEDLIHRRCYSRFITGLRAPISQQLLLKNSKPGSLDQALKLAGEVEFALNFEKHAYIIGIHWMIYNYSYNGPYDYTAL